MNIENHKEFINLVLNDFKHNLDVQSIPEAFEEAVTTLSEYVEFQCYVSHSQGSRAIFDYYNNKHLTT